MGFWASFPLDRIICMDRLLFWSNGTQSEKWFVEFSAAEKLNLIQLFSARFWRNLENGNSMKNNRVSVPRPPMTHHRRHHHPPRAITNDFLWALFYKNNFFQTVKHLFKPLFRVIHYCKRRRSPCASSKWFPLFSFSRSNVFNVQLSIIHIHSLRK